MENGTKGYVYKEEVIHQILSYFDNLDKMTGRDKTKAIASIILALENPIGITELKQQEQEQENNDIT